VRSAAAYLRSSTELLEAMAIDPVTIVTMERIAKLIGDALEAGNKVMFVGNGGSAADAQHLAGEFVGRFAFDRLPMPAIALTTDTSVLTAVANDYGYAAVFLRQIAALGRAGDVLVAMSTSGNSQNVVMALEVAKLHGLSTVGLTGDMPNCKMAKVGLCDALLRVPSGETPLIQQAHMVIGHWVCGAVEERLCR
jgi:D-sedoheptulose 7-phosphate isomerase